MSRPRVFVTQPIAESALKRLRAVADVEVNADSSRVLDKAKLIEAVKRCDILLSLLHDTVDREVLTRQSAAQGRVVDEHHAGPHRSCDGDRRSAFRSPTFRPSSPTPPPISASGCCFRSRARSRSATSCCAQGVYPGSQSNHLAGAAVTGKTLGLVGFGRIGQAMARRARGFDMKIVYADPRRLARKRKSAVRRRLSQPSTNLLREADFVSLHPQLTPETRHLMSDRQFSLMKPTAFVINTSRGPVIDEAALVRALKEKKIAGAGLDVYEHEPEVSPELAQMPNVVLTPHLGSAVLELREGMANVVVDNTIATDRGQAPPLNCINPQVLKKLI